MKTLVIVVAVLASACTTDGQAADPSPVELCGQPPLAPGFSVAYRDGVATLPADQMQAISRFAADYDTWANCILSLKD
jgi:hypothetical protein